VKTNSQSKTGDLKKLGRQNGGKDAHETYAENCKKALIKTLLGCAIRVEFKAGERKFRHAVHWKIKRKHYYRDLTWRG